MTVHKLPSIYRHLEIYPRFDDGIDPFAVDSPVFERGSFLVPDSPRKLPLRRVRRAFGRGDTVHMRSDLVLAPVGER